MMSQGDQAPATGMAEALVGGGEMGVLRESETWYRSLFEAIDEGFCVIEAVGEPEAPSNYRYLVANPAFETHTGLHNVVGKTIRELLPDVEEDWLHTYDRVARTGEPLRFERFLAPLGRWLNLYALRVGAPAQRRVAVLFTDITARKRADGALRASEERFRGFAENFPDGLWIADTPTRRFTYLSPAFAHLWGVPRESLRGGLDCWAETVVHPDERAGALDTLARLSAGETVVSEHRVIRLSDGAVRWLRDTGFPIRDEMGVVRRIAGISQDSTPIKELEQAREEFLASVTHELQTPLTSIRAGLVLLEVGAGVALGPDERTLLAAMRRNAERLRLLIADLLAARALQSAALEPERAAVDLSAVAAAAVAAVRPLLEEKGQPLELDLPAALPVVGDARLLEQVVVNLLVNAHRHTPAGTRIAVTGWVDDAGDGEDVAETVRLVVRDNGPGIPADALDAIFERFYRRNRHASGTGLGLTVARDMVGLHGGRLWAESPPGSGATFHIALPRRTPAAGEPNGPRAGDGEDGL